jgi:hypothetical protein
MEEPSKKLVEKDLSIKRSIRRINEPLGERTNYAGACPSRRVR